MPKKDWYVEGCKYQKGKALEKALRCFNVCIKQNPKHAHAHFLIGTIWMEKTSWAIAMHHLQKAHELGAADFKLLNAVRNNLAVCYRRLDQTDKALELFTDSTKRHVDANLLSNTGSCNLDLGRWEDAERALRRGQIVTPTHNDANWNLSLALLSQRKWREAWYQHEWGFRAKERGIRPYINHWPFWQGQSLEGKTILLWGEQGIGDELLFAGCFENIRKLKPREVIFDCHPRLVGLYRRSFPWMRVYGRRKDPTVAAMIYAQAAAQLSGFDHLAIGNLVNRAIQEDVPFDAVYPQNDNKGWVRLNQLPPKERQELRRVAAEREVFFRWKPDYQIAVGTLPKHFRNQDGDFLDVKADFLAADAARVAHYRDKYPTDSLRIGLCWLGGSRKTAVHRRSIPLEKFVELLKLPATWISLQYGDVGYEVQQVNCKYKTNLIHDEYAIEDLDELAALTKSCDLVISVIQTQVHMAGALGVETLCLTCHAPPWKFHDPIPGKADINLWHPYVTHIRQGKGDEWPLESIRSLVASRLRAMKPTEKIIYTAFGNSSRPLYEHTST